MSALFPRIFQTLKLGLKSLTILIVCTLLVNFSVPSSLAGNLKSTNTELEAQVLQIIRNHPEVILESVQKYQQEQQEKQQQGQEKFLQQMKANPKSVVGSSPAQGSLTQKVVLMEFSDFQCPYCAQAHQTLKQFMAKHQTQVTLVYKHLPLTQIHPEAMNSAKAAWAAQQQGKFWEFHDALFTQQDQLGEQLYVDTATALKLDLAKFKKDRQSQVANAAIEQDMELAAKVGVRGTPFLVMNGEVFSGAAELADLEATLTKVSRR